MEGKVIEAAGGVTDGAVIGLEDRYGIHHSEGLPECKSRKRVRLCINCPENGRETLFSFSRCLVDSRLLGRHMGSSYFMPESPAAGLCNTPSFWNKLKRSGPRAGR